MKFSHGQTVTHRTLPELRFIVIGTVREDFGAGVSLTSYRIRSAREHADPLELIVSAHEIEAVESPNPYAKKCDTCGLPSVLWRRTAAGLFCKECHEKQPAPETVTLENGQTATVQAVINADIPAMFHQQREIIDTLKNGKAHRPALEWHQHAYGISQSVCGHYDVNVSSNGFIATFMRDPSNTDADESSGALPTREAAKAWAERHAAGEELEPNRCERCQMPTMHRARICDPCSLILNEPVAVPMGRDEQPF